MGGFCTKRRLFLITILVSVAMAAETFSRSPAAAAWRVVFERTDVTGMAAPIPAGNGVMVDVAGIGVLFGIHFLPETSSFSIRGIDGRVWHGRHGDSTLYSAGEMLPMSAPALYQSANLFIPAETMAELADLSVRVDGDAECASFSRRAGLGASPIAPRVVGDGWTAFTIKKPTPTHVSAPGTKKPVPRTNPPSARERLNVGLGVGYVQDLDWGLQFSASGRLWGGNTAAWGLVTLGDGTAKLHNSHLKWIDEEDGRGVEAGDLYSESWGFVRGLRYSWRRNENRWPWLGIYLKTNRTENPEATVSYRDELRLGKETTARVEAGSDESLYAGAAYSGNRLDVFAFTRHLPDDYGQSEGLYASYRIGSRAHLFCGLHSSTDRLDHDSRLRTLGLRLPISRVCNLVLQQSEHESESGQMRSRSVGITMPLAHAANLYLRYQTNSLDADVLSGRVISLKDDTSSLLASLSLFAGRRVHLDYQQSIESHMGRSRSTEQLIANIRLSPTSTLQTISGFPNIADSNLLRIRLDQRLSDSVSLLLEYGNLSPYQATDAVFGRRGFQVMLRRTWTLQVPARGGSVHGKVTDQLGHPIEDIVVKLGKYTASTDATGRYAFESVPTGRYNVTLSAECIPADYKVDATSQEVVVSRDSSHTVDFSLVPLGCITGRVYLDENENGRFDEGEGVRDVGVCANEFTTATGTNGEFAFCNLEPRSYQVRIAPETLSQQFSVSGAGVLEANLKPNGGVSGIEFRLTRRTRPVIFTTLRAES